MFKLKDISVKNKMFVLIGIFITGFIAFGIFAFSTLNTVKIGGDLQEELVKYRKLTSEATVPNLFILDVAYHANRLQTLVQVGDTIKVNERIETLKKAIRDNRESVAEWQKADFDEKLKDLLVVKAQKSAGEYITIVENELIPAAQKGDKEKALDLTSNALAAKFVEHRAVIDQAAPMMAAKIKEGNENAAGIVSWRTTMLVSAAIFVIALVMLVGWMIIRSVVGPLAQVVEKLKGMSIGDYNQTLDYQSKDEVGLLADAFRSSVEYIKEVSETVDAIRKGDLSKKLVPRSPLDQLSNNLNQAINSLQNLTVETTTLTQTVSNGNIDARCNTDKLEGSFAEVLNGMNDLLNAVSIRVKVVAERAEQLSGLCITNFGKGTQALAVGDLDFQIITGTPFLNDTSPDSIGNMTRSVDSIIKQTQATIVSFEESRLILREVISEGTQLTAEANNGNINVRGDAAKYKGGFRELIAGMNNLLEAVAKPINEASDCLQRVAERDLTAQMTGEYKGDFDKIKTALNTALDNLSEGLGQVSVGAEQVASAATEISAGSQNLAQGASEQASTLEEVAGNLQEISSMTKQNTANSKEARALSDSARNAAEGGMTNMQRLSEAVMRIKDSSDSTAKIVKTIEEIALQTNLLALNAAVEAARAGDAGKGFAVVAEEVRNLAMRSAEAAKTTAQLIEEAVKNTEDGVNLNAEVSQNLVEINAQIEKVSVVMTEISAASEQQNQGVEQINVSVEQMNSVTQQTAANSEESAAAAEELSGQSQEMLSLISSFRLSGSQVHGVKPRSNGGMMKKPAQRKPQPAVAAANNGGAWKSKTTNGNGFHSDSSDLIPFDDGDSVLREF